MLRRRVLDVLAASLAAAGSSKEIAPPKCIKAEPPRVDATGRLTSGDLAGAFSTHGATLAHVAPNGSYYAKYDGAALRNAFAGRWLYFMGDSSLRGVVLAFLMQLQSFAGADYVERGSGGRGDELIVRRWMADRDGCVLARTPPAERFRDALTLGWLDAVVDAPSGALVALRSGGHDSRLSWEGSKPAVDQSGALAGAWCGRSEHCGAGRVRLTYRMTTRALHLTNESFDVLRGGAGRGRPDVFVYESGAWDLAVYGTYAKKDPQRAAKLISWPVLGATQLRVLENLARAAAATQLPRPRLIYATMPVAFSPLDACADGSWERRVLAALRDRLGNDLEPPQLLNRVAARTALAVGVPACPCLGQLTDHHPASLHPAHLINLWDVQRLANMLAPERAAGLRAPFALGAGGFGACCCTKAKPMHVLQPSGTAHWAVLCRLAESDVVGSAHAALKQSCT